MGSHGMTRNLFPAMPSVSCNPAFISRHLRALFSLDFSVWSAIGPSQRFREIAWLCSDTLQCRVSFPRCISSRFLHGLKKLLRYETAVGMDASRVYSKSGWDECLDDDWDVIRVDQILQSYNGMSSGVEWREAFRTWRRLDKELAAHLHLFTDAAQPLSVKQAANRPPHITKVGRWPLALNCPNLP